MCKEVLTAGDFCCCMGELAVDEVSQSKSNLALFQMSARLQQPR
ncbi:hypothetical protein COLO4_05690 [Corchorus olitorius]|uniref:Uncharacterized protein n=1 Tax=Corchorus olitorius TaxID=93759 RepID=A0A1R3KQB4_9ROSI|nr:hypothetical protein COLO4_05690 [Corchorus olitorius]